MELDWNKLLSEIITKPGTLSTAYSAFWEYSLGNQIAAMHQCIDRGLDLGPINTYKRWQNLQRQVAKGQKALWLCMPVTAKSEDTATGDVHVFTRFIWRPHWFVLAQTTGQDYQREVRLPTWDKDMALAALKIEEAPFTHMSGNCQGYATQDGKISVSPIAAYPHKTRFHELAHIVLGHTKEGTMSDSERTPRHLRECEAESTAYILCTLLLGEGFPGADSSRAYVQGWMDGEGISDKSAQKIFGAANKILRAGQAPIAEQT